jgi:hypothetical protein
MDVPRPHTAPDMKHMFLVTVINPTFFWVLMRRTWMC